VDIGLLANVNEDFGEVSEDSEPSVGSLKLGILGILGGSLDFSLFGPKNEVLVDPGRFSWKRIRFGGIFLSIVVFVDEFTIFGDKRAGEEIFDLGLSSCVLQI